MEVCLLESDIAYLELTDVISKFNDLYTIQSFTEDGNSGSSNKLSNMISAIKKKIEDFFKKIKDTLTKLFTGNEVAEIKKEMAEYEKELENKKMEALDSKKLYALTKSYKKKIMNATTKSEIDQIVADYKMKQKGCTHIVTAITAFGIAIGANRLAEKFRKDSDDTIDAIIRNNRAYSHDQIDEKTWNANDTALEKKRHRASEHSFSADTVSYYAKAVGAGALVYPVTLGIYQLYTTAAKAVQDNAVKTMRKAESMTSNGKESTDTDSNAK